ncbi:MAG: hypothetical protein QMD09_04185 [Desulfatibacillaceae bacterium]|nr:hypothetical protein [Desulfatibacillaceae bacterium]
MKIAIKFFPSVLLILLLAAPASGAVVSSRKMPLNPDVKTFGTDPSRDFTHPTGLADWELATRGNITGEEAKSPVLECYADEAFYNISAQVAFGNAVANTSATKFRVIKAASGHENRFRKNAGVIFRHAMTGINDYYAFNTLDEAYLSFHDLGFTAHTTHNSTKNRGIIYCNKITTGAGNTKIVGCYFFDLLNVGAGRFYTVFTSRAKLAFNCVTDNCDYGLQLSNAFNCTAVGCNVGFSANFATNCIAQGNVTDFSGGTQTNCVTSGVVFADDGISLAPSDIAARDQGMDLYGTHAFNDDGMGRKRGNGRTTGPAWDIGALEFYAPLSARRIPFLLF